MEFIGMIVMWLAFAGPAQVVRMDSPQFAVPRHDVQMGSPAFTVPRRRP